MRVCLDLFFSHTTAVCLVLSDALFWDLQSTNLQSADAKLGKADWWTWTLSGTSLVNTVPHTRFTSDYCIPMRMYLAPFTVDVELFQINVQHIKMYKCINKHMYEFIL